MLHIMDKNGCFISYNDFCSKFNVCEKKDYFKVIKIILYHKLICQKGILTCSSVIRKILDLRLGKISFVDKKCTNKFIRHCIVQECCKGIKYLEHIFEGTDFIPFDKLIKQYGINKNRFLEYQQIKSIVKRKFKSNHINLQIPPSVSDFLNLKTPKLMSKIYRALSKIDESVSLPIAKWEADLSIISGLRYV